MFSIYLLIVNVTLLQVVSEDYWERSRIEGYGHLGFPMLPGYHARSIQTWIPISGIPTLYLVIRLGLYIAGMGTNIRFSNPLPGYHARSIQTWIPISGISTLYLDIRLGLYRPGYQYQVF